MTETACFITCVNNDDLYNECLDYISRLDVPTGINIQTIAIRGAKSITSGYNSVLSNKAKYKIYLHQDTFIIDRFFIHKIINVFNGDPKIGLLGVIGSKDITKDAVWWHGKQKYGKVFENRTGASKLLSFGDVNNDYQSVKFLDGLILVSQYDIRWRDDIFDGWHFYDMSQCLEFIKAGYQVVIPKQDTPWCFHACGTVSVEKYDHYRLIFLHEYARYLFPFSWFFVLQYNKYKLKKIQRKH